MKYLELTLLSEVNAMFNQLNNKNFNINLEAYSCKYTKKQRKQQNYKNVTAHLINTLELANLTDRRKLEKDDFKLKQFSEFKNDIFLIFTRNKYLNSVVMTKIMCLCIYSVIGVDKTLIFSLDKRSALLSDNRHFLCYFFYNKKRKRILLMTLFYALNNR